MASDSAIDAANAASESDSLVAILAVRGASSWNMTLECLDDCDVVLADRDLGLTGGIAEGIESSALSEKGVSSWNMTLACLDERGVVLPDRDLGLDGGFASSVLLELSEC